MTAERWRQISAIYNAAIARGGADRTAYVSSACTGDDDLRREVELLLKQGESFLAQPIAMAAGSRIGAYELLEIIGAGGMGIVYRARDLKLQRDVALKVLRDAVALGPERIARFRREATVLASLNHPHIGAIYGFEDSGDVHGLVLELVEGPTLADRIAQGAIPVDEALPIARQIAEALEAAHEQGVIHRDLKPANIKLRPDGTVKVLDFGLAKALEPIAGAAQHAEAASLSPTITSPALISEVGVLLGTAAYMSPEQARGKTADKRSDMWAFGCVLYEMLTGKVAFAGDGVADTLAAVLRGEPDWTALPRNTPASVCDILRRCVQKDRKQRLPDMAVVLFLMDQKAPRASTVRSSVIASSLAILTLAIVAVGIRLFMNGHAAPTPRVGRFTIKLTGPVMLSTPSPFPDIAMSPDGTSIVYNATGSRSVAMLSGLMLRRVDRLDAGPIPGTTASGAPFFSPDGRWVGFFSGAELKKVPISGGPPISICHVGGIVRGASWGSDGTIVFSVNGGPGLQRVSADGGTPAQLTTVDPSQGESQHVLPAVLPGNRAVLFTVTLRGNPSNALTVASNTLIAAVNLTDGSRKTLIRGGSHPQFVEPGYLVYQSAGSLMAVRFDPRRLEVLGEAVPMVAGVFTKPDGVVEYAISGDGTLAYVPRVTTEPELTNARTLVWVNRNGREEPIDAPPRPYVYARLSPDENRIALDVRDENRDIWIWSLLRRTLTRLTSDPGLETSPLWMPDGRSIVFGSQRAGASNLYRQNADDTAAPERLTTSPINQVPSAITPDGRTILYWEATPRTNLDILALHLDAPRHTSTVLATAFAEDNADVSPDGRWLAYESAESNETQVYVRSFSAADGGRLQISRSGGHLPRWAYSGHELFYFNERNELMAVPVSTEPMLTVGGPAKVLDAKYFAGAPGANARTYDVSRDGQRFLMIKGVTAGGPEGGDEVREMVIVLNWREELAARLRAD